MAVYTVSNTGGNYNVGTTWVGGIVPSTTDTIEFTPTSGNLTISVAATCAGIDFTNYVGTLTVNASFRINGNINLGTGGYTVGGSNTTYIGATGTITSNGVVWAGNFGFLGTSQTYTLADDLTVNGVITHAVTTVGTLNGFNLYAKGTLNITNGSLIGTTDLYLIGTGTLNVVGGNMILGLNTTINTTGTITFGANGVKFGNGKTFTYISGTVNATNGFFVSGTCSLDVAAIAFNGFQINGTSTVCTLLADITINGELRFNGATSCTVNGFNLLCYNNVYFQPANFNIVGTSTVQVLGTCTWTHQSSSYCGLNVVFNTAGTITISANGFRLRNPCTFIYTSGTVTGTLNLILFSGAVSMDSSPITWATMTVSGISTLNLLSDIYFSGLFQLNSGLTVNGAYTCYVGGQFRRVSNTATIFNSTLTMNDNSSWSDLYPSTTITFANMRIDCTTFKIIGNVGFRGVMNYVNGIVDATGSTITIGATVTTLNINSDTSSQSPICATGINLDNLVITGNIAITLPSNIRVCGNLQVTGNSFTNGRKVYVAGNYYITSNTGTGTYTIVMDGTGTWYGTAAVRNNLTIDTLGVITISGQVNFSGYASATLTYVSGTVITTGSNLVLSLGGTNFNTNGIIWNDVTISASATIYLYSTFSISGTFIIRQTTNLFGTAGFVTNNLALEFFNKNLQLTAGVTYTVTGAFTCTGTSSTQRWTIYSTASADAYFNLLYGGTQNLIYCDATWINSLGGQTIYCAGAGLSNTKNWKQGTTNNNTSSFLMMF